MTATNLDTWHTADTPDGYGHCEECGKTFPLVDLTADFWCPTCDSAWGPTGPEVHDCPYCGRETLDPAACPPCRRRLAAEGDPCFARPDARQLHIKTYDKRVQNPHRAQGAA